MILNCHRIAGALFLFKSAWMPQAQPRTPPDPIRHAASAVSVRRLRIALGTWLAVEASAETEADALTGIGAAYAAVSKVERLMHPSCEGSDLKRINSAQPGSVMAIHASTAQVLRFAQRLHEVSGGVFDPCLPEKPGRVSDLAFECPGAEPDEVAVAPARNCSVKCLAPVALDLGGVAKGYAIDRAVEALRRAGCSAGLVNAGGDLRLFGARCEIILLRRTAGKHRRLWLRDSALAVSDLDACERPPEHRGYYFRSDAGASSRRYAAVLAQEAMTADALTKCVLLCPPAHLERVLREYGGRVVA